MNRRRFATILPVIIIAVLAIASVYLVQYQIPSTPESVKNGLIAAQWGPDLRLTFDPGTSQLSFNFAWSIAADEAGRVHLVWYDTLDGFSQVYYKRSLDGGMTWQPVIRLSRGQHPAIAIWGSQVYVVWHDSRNGNFDIYFKRSIDGGESWEQERPLTTSGRSAHASIAASRSDVYVVWGDVRDGQAEIYTRRSSDAGMNWEAETRLSDVPFESWVPTVAVSGNNVYVAWVDYRDANEEEYFRRSTDGGITWGLVTRLTNDSADSWAPSIAAAGDTLHLTWFDRRHAGVTDTQVEAKLDQAMELVGLPAQTTPPRSSFLYYLPGFTQRVQEKTQQIQSVAPGWVQRGGDPTRLEAILQEFEQLMRSWAMGWEIYYKRSIDGGATWEPDVRITNAAGPSARPSIAVSVTDVHIVWYDFRDGNAEIYYKHSPDGGATWGPDVRLTYAQGDSVNPTVTVADNLVHMVWFDQRDGNAEVYYKRKVG